MEGIRIVRLGNFLVIPVSYPREDLGVLSRVGNSWGGAEVHAVHLSPTCFGLVIWPDKDQSMEDAIFYVLSRIWHRLETEGLVAGRMELVRTPPDFLFLNEDSELDEIDGVVYVGGLPVGRLSTAETALTSRYSGVDPVDTPGLSQPELSAARKHLTTDPGMM